MQPTFLLPQEISMSSEVVIESDTRAIFLSYVTENIAFAGFAMWQDVTCLFIGFEFFSTKKKTNTFVFDLW